MKMERSDWEELRERLQAQQVESRRPQLERSIQAAVAAENLTGSPEWDYYLSRIQARKEEADARVAQAEQVLTGPDCTYESLVAAKLALAEARGQAAAYADALSMPAEIVKQGEQAKELLKDG